MQKAGLPVPPFCTVDTRMTKAIEDLPVDTNLLKAYIPALEELSAQNLSLTDIKSWISSFSSEETDKRKQCLEALSEFIVSDDFYQQLARQKVAGEISFLYNRLFPHSQPVIVRSSGVTEDNYGDAQAGRYKSVVHKGKDILRSCLEVMASSYKPEVCPQGIPQPMAIILQKCIDCRFGGVVMSYSSLKDNTSFEPVNNFAYKSSKGVVTSLLSG